MYIIAMHMQRLDLNEITTVSANRCWCSCVLASGGIATTEKESDEGRISSESVEKKKKRRVVLHARLAQSTSLSIVGLRK